MTTSTIVLIVVIAVAAILLIAAIAWVARNKRTQHRRVEAGDIRDKATDESHKVGQREAFADETAAKARVAQAEADAKTAHATGLQHQAQVRRSDATTARDEVNQEFERADKIDPDSQTPEDKRREDSETRAAPRGTSGGKQGPPSMSRAG
jgi:FtsZ-interacting cell division protein ZipA